MGLTNHVLDGNAHWHHVNTMKDPYAVAMWPYYFDHLVYMYFVTG